MSYKLTPLAIARGLRRGDIVQNTGSGESYVVLREHPPILAVRETTVSNPQEWQLVEFPESES